MRHCVPQPPHTSLRLKTAPWQAVRRYSSSRPLLQVSICAKAATPVCQGTGHFGEGEREQKHDFSVRRRFILRTLFARQSQIGILKFPLLLSVREEHRRTELLQKARILGKINMPCCLGYPRGVLLLFDRKKHQFCAKRSRISHESDSLAWYRR